ncbi:MAG: DUF3224 domain-containing protein [Pyrinomonadaceae bacterium]
MRFRIVHVIVILILLLSMPVAIAQTTSLTGDWSGESICAGNNPNCHDEKVVYHISVNPSDSNMVKIAADTIVNSKPEWMGDIFLKYDPDKQTLTADLQNSRYRGIWEFSVKGNIIEGTLSVFAEKAPEKTIARRIKVKRNESTPKESSMTQHAAGAFEVKITPADDKSDDKTLGRMTLEKQWHGDLDGASRGQMLTGGDVTKGSAGYVAIEKFTGTLNGRKGSFILQHSAIMTRGEGQMTITVVPDSGTDQLKGISGKLTIKIENGKHSYEFDYNLE